MQGHLPLIIELLRNRINWAAIILAPEKTKKDWVS